ncbi:MAG: energy transducer TonB [Bacteroidota bacterium]
MEPKTFLNADYLDIIYASRNKEYGGYELRKNYDRRVRKGAGFLLLGVTALSCFSFITTKPVENRNNNMAPVVITEVVLPNKLVEPPRPRIETPPPPPDPVAMKKSVVPIITDEPITDDDAMVQNKDMKNVQSGPANVVGDTLDVGIGPGIVGGKPGGTAVVTATVPDKPRIWVEQMPQFAGNMSDYLSKRINYPEVARNNGIQGRVVVKFVVNEDGTVSDAVVVKGIGGGCDEEALRIVRSMPAWKAGKQNGIPVKVYFTLPLSFVLGD